MQVLNLLNDREIIITTELYVFVSKYKPIVRPVQDVNCFMAKFTAMLESQLIFCNSRNAYVYRRQSRDKDKTYNSFLTYTVVSPCFRLRTTPLSAISQQVRRFVLRYLSSSEYRKPPQKWSLNLLIPGSSHIVGLGTR